MTTRLTPGEQQAIYQSIIEKILMGWDDERIVRKLANERDMPIVASELRELVAQLRPHAQSMKQEVVAKGKSTTRGSVIIMILGLLLAGIGVVLTLVSDGESIFIGAIAFGGVLFLGGIFYFFASLVKRSTIK
jgi:hypothetical protein